MAQPDLEKFTRRGVLLNVQAVAGTPEPLVAGTDGVYLYDGQSGTEVDTVEENRDRPYYSGNPVAIANKRGFITGELRLVPPAVPGDAVDGIPSCDQLLRPAGMTRVLDAAGRVTRYNPISQGIPISTAQFFHAGTFMEVYDARHSLSAIALEIGQRAKAQLRIQGSYDALTEAALPTIPVPDEVGAVISASTGRTQLRVDGGAWLNVWGKALTVDHGTTLATKEYTEHKETSIDDRKGTFTLRIAKTALADFNPVAVRDGEQVFEATLRVKDAAGLYTMLGIRGQITGVSTANIDGDYGWEITGPCIASSDGGDESFIEFGDVSLILTGTLGNGTIGNPYTDALTAEGEHDTLTWSISAGVLPDGLSINPATGEISGTPTQAEVQTFTVQATDGTQTATSEQTITIT